MKHANSNKNLLKKALGNHRKKNAFKKSSTNNNFNYNKSNNTKGRKNLISLLEKNTPTTSFNSKKFNFNSKNNNNIKKEIYLTSGIEKGNMDDDYKTMHNQRNINIRLNLNSEIINNNFNNYYTTKNKNLKNLNNISLNEKIKEKDKLITKLQKELLQSQELLNKIQKDKQNELTITYNTIKKFDSLDKKNNKSLITLLKSPSLLKFNCSRKIKGNLNKNYYNIFNSGLNYNNKRKYKIAASSPKHKYIRCFSSSPNRFFSYNLDNLESYNSNFLTKNTLYQKSNNINGINSRSNSNLFMKKNEKFPTELYVSRHLSYINYNYKNMNIKANNKFMEKCEKLKKRAKDLLNNYILLIERNLGKEIKKNKK